MIARLLGVATSLFLVVVDAGAHHSRAAFYDLSQVIEAEGEITRVLWRNPHVRFWMEDDAGAQWELETTPPGILARHGIGQDVLTVGTRIRIAGPPARFEENSMEVRNVLLPDGREVLIQRETQPRWTEEALTWAPPSFPEVAVRAAEAGASGVFRVWSRNFGQDREPFGLTSYPLTGAAQALRAAYDPVADNPIPGCTAKGMPMIMGNPYPFEFVQDGDRIRLLIEEYDLVRLIHMKPDTDEAPPSILGHSVGHWEEGDLVVATTNISFMHFGSSVSLSADARVLERFSLSADESRLDYTMTVIDPETFTEPVTQRKYWLWRPGETIEPWDCLESDPE